MVLLGGKAMQTVHLGGNPPCLLQVRACFILIKLCLLFGMMSITFDPKGYLQAAAQERKLSILLFSFECILIHCTF